MVPAAPDCRVCDLARAGLPSVALRVPAPALTRALLARVGRPVAAPSANRSGRVSPTSADHVLADLEGRIAAVADVFDALTSERVYQAAHPADDARAILEAGRGTLFDPAVLDVFHAARDEIEAVRVSEVGAPSASNVPNAGSGGVR